MSSDEAKLFKGLQRIISQNDKVEQSFKKIGDEGRKAGNAGADGGKKAAGGMAELASRMTSVVAGIASVNMVIRTTIDLIRKAHEEQQRATEQTRALKTSRADLATVASGSTAAERAADFKAMDARASQAAVANAIDPALARSLLFQARSGGYEADFENVARSARVLDPGAVGTVATKLPSIFSGQLTATQSINAVLKASQKSDATFTDIARVAPTASEGGKAIGSSPEETLAALSVLSAQFKSPETAAERIKSFGAGLSTRGFSGGLLSTLDKLQAMSPEERKKVLGDSQELNIAYGNFTEGESLIRQRKGEISSAIGSDVVGSVVETYLSDPKSKALFLSDQSQIRKDLLAEGAFSADELRRQGTISNLQAESIQSGEMGFVRAGRMSVAQGLSSAAAGAGLKDDAPAVAEYGFENAGTLVGKTTPLGMLNPFSTHRIATDIADAIVEKLKGPKVMAQPDVDK